MQDSAGQTGWPADVGCCYSLTVFPAVLGPVPVVFVSDQGNPDRFNIQQRRASRCGSTLRSA